MAEEGGSSGESLAALLESNHASYISGLAAKLDAPGSYEGAVTEHLRMSGVYWSIAALSLLRSPEEVNEIMGLDAIIDWLFSAWPIASQSASHHCYRPGSSSSLVVSCLTK
jgi:hypothetical protein